MIGCEHVEVGGNRIRNDVVARREVGGDLRLLGVGHRLQAERAQHDILAAQHDIFRFSGNAGLFGRPGVDVALENEAARGDVPPILGHGGRAGNCEGDLLVGAKPALFERSLIDTCQLMQKFDLLIFMTAT